MLLICDFSVMQTDFIVLKSYIFTVKSREVTYQIIRFLVRDNPEGTKESVANERFECLLAEGVSNGKF